MMPIETISPNAPIRVRPVQVRPPARRGGHRGPQPSRPLAAPPRYRGTGVLMSTAPHRPRPITPSTTVALALLAALITVWLGLVAHFGDALRGGPEQTAGQMADRLARGAGRARGDAPALGRQGRTRCADRSGHRTHPRTQRS